MTAPDFTPVTPEAAAAALDAALLDGAPADERLLDAWSTIVAMGEQTRAIVVRALQDLAESNFYDGDSDRPCDGYYDLIDRAIAIENGADL